MAFYGCGAQAYTVATGWHEDGGGADQSQQRGEFHYARGNHAEDTAAHNSDGCRVLSTILHAIQHG